MSDKKFFPVGVPVSAEDFGIQPDEPPPPAAPTPAEGPAINGESQAGAAIRGVESGALAGFNEKAAAGSDTATSHVPWLADFAAKVSGVETLRDPSLTYDQRLQRYKAAAAESASKYPKTTIAADIAGAALPTATAAASRRESAPGAHSAAPARELRHAGTHCAGRNGDLASNSMLRQR